MLLVIFLYLNSEEARKEDDEERSALKLKQTLLIKLGWKQIGDSIVNCKWLIPTTSLP